MSSGPIISAGRNQNVEFGEKLGRMGKRHQRAGYSIANDPDGLTSPERLPDIRQLPLSPACSVSPHFVFLLTKYACGQAP